MKKKRRNYHLYENIIYLARESWDYDRRILIFSLISIVTGIVLPLFQIYLPKAAVDLFVQRADLPLIAKTLGVVVGGFLILQAVNGYVSTARYFMYNDMRNVFLQKIFLTSIDCEYSEAENGESLEMYQRAVNVTDRGIWGRPRSFTRSCRRSSPVSAAFSCIRVFCLRFISESCLFCYFSLL